MGDYVLIEANDHGINQSVSSPSSNIIEPKNKTASQKLLYLLSSPSRYVQAKFKAGGMTGSIFTILASTVGAGILSLPFAINLSGLYQGIFLFVFGMIVSLYSCQLLVLAAEKTGKLTYESIALELYGQRMRKFSEVNMIINNYGTVIGYIVLLKDMVPNALNMFGVDNEVALSPFLWGSLITVTIVFPLSLQKEISALRYTSFVSTCSCIYLGIAVLYSFFHETSNTNKKFAEAPAARPEIYNILTSIGLVVFSFTCHPNVIPIYEELERRSTKRGFRFLSRGLLIVLVLYLTVGIFGFLTFYNEYSVHKFPAQILQADYSRNNIPIIIVRTT
jgi:sodium-coupled neutral amino acid transporter 2